MKRKQLKVARIGNSRGVRLPAASLRRYRIGATVLMEERSEGILLRPTGPAVEKLSWEDTAREMAASDEDWSAWDAVVAGDPGYRCAAGGGRRKSRWTRSARSVNRASGRRSVRYRIVRPQHCGG